MSSPESLADTVRSVCSYFDMLIVRHRDAKAVEGVFEVATVPVINAGAGNLSHPTQALIDLYAIRRGLGSLDGLRIGIAGDLVNSRAARSLVTALSFFNLVECRLIAPTGRELPDTLLDSINAAQIQIDERLNVRGLDVLYMAGCPRGTGANTLEDGIRERIALTPDILAEMRKDGIVLCPLPRVDEISRSVDQFPQAQYFRQSADGLFVRMAVLEHMFSEGST